MKSPHKIALVFRLMPGYCEGIVRGVARFARPAHNWSIQLFEKADGTAIAAFQPEAIICCVTQRQAATSIRRFACPIVNVGFEELLPQACSVGNDDLQIGEVAANYFLDRGFSHFAY